MADVLSDLRTRARYALEEAAASYWSDAELNSQIVQSYRKLWKKIVAIRKDWFAATTGTLTLTAAASSKYSLDATCFHVRGIRTTTSGRENVTLQRKTHTDQQFIEALRADIAITNPSVMWYDILGNNTLFVAPLVRSSIAIAYEYIATPTDPTTDASTFGVLDPFTEYILLDAICRALAKGPIGALDFWRGERQEEWATVMSTLGMPRSDQSADYVEGMFDNEI